MTSKSVTGNYSVHPGHENLGQVNTVKKQVGVIGRKVSDGKFEVSFEFKQHIQPWLS